MHEPKYANLTLEQLARERHLLAANLRAVDRQIARLDAGRGPFVIVRSDGATLHGTWANRREFTHDRAPYRFMYRKAADKVAVLHGAAVLPFATWQGGQTQQQAEGRSDRDHATLSQVQS